MDEYRITITDPNYRDTKLQTEWERAERASSAKKLAHAAAREERWFNEPFLYEKIFAKLKQIHNHLFPTQKIR